MGGDVRGAHAAESRIEREKMRVLSLVAGESRDFLLGAETVQNRMRCQGRLPCHQVPSLVFVFLPSLDSVGKVAVTTNNEGNPMKTETDCKHNNDSRSGNVVILVVIVIIVILAICLTRCTY